MKVKYLWNKVKPLQSLSCRLGCKNVFIFKTFTGSSAMFKTLWHKWSHDINGVLKFPSGNTDARKSCIGAYWNMINIKNTE